MKSTIQNIVAVIAGIFLGSLVNMSLVELGPLIIPLPEGADMSTLESLRVSMKLLSPANLIFPFLAHALGTLVGAFIAARFATGSPMKFAMGIGVFFLIGGIAAVKMFGGPMWFNVTDIVLAYIPMGYLGAVLAERQRTPSVEG